MSGKFLVKVRRYSGAESIVAFHATKELAAAEAERYNTEYQTDTYYVEPWDDTKCDFFGPR